MSVCVGKFACPCGVSSDAFAVYRQDDGSFNGTCYSGNCPKRTGDKNYFTRLDDDFQPVERRDNMQTTQYGESLTEIYGYPSLEVPARGLLQATMQKYGVKVAVNPTTGEHQAHYYPMHKDGSLTGYKKRTLPKIFSTVGDGKGAEFFGQHLMRSGGKMLIVTEGELDAMSAYQMSVMRNGSGGRGYRCISLPYGSGPQSIEAVKRNLEFLESFEKVVLCLDNDAPGRETTEKIAEILSPGKAWQVEWDPGLSVKDASDMLQRGLYTEFMDMILAPKQFSPAGIVSSGDTWELLQNRERKESVPFPEGWGLNDIVYGLRQGELTTITSGSGSGKTQVLREIQYNLYNRTDANMGIIALEEPLHDTIEALLALHLNARIQLPDVKYDIADYQEAWNYIAAPNRIHMYDHWGSVEQDSLFSKIRYMAKALDCKYIFLDHLSIVVSEYAASGDERRQIDEIMSKLKRLTQELDICLVMVVHLRKAGGNTSFEEGAVPSTDDLRGSGSIKQLSNNVYAIARNQQHPDEYMRNTSSVHVLKDRFTGRTGPAGWLHFHAETGRMIPVDDPQVDYEARLREQIEEGAGDSGFV